MDNFFGDPYMMWHDGVDETAAAELEGEEREKAEEMLIESMVDGSYWAPMGLREMKSIKAIPALKERLPTAHCRQLIEIAHALFVLENNLNYIDDIIRALRNCGSPYDRLVAAMRLRKFDIPEIREKVIAALFDAVEDPDYLVRNHSCESLLALHGFTPSISEHSEIFGHIISEFDPEDTDDVEAARAHFRTAVELLRKLLQEKK